MSGYNVAFVYARTSNTSGWTYGHELGRQYLEESLGGQITTSFVDNVPVDGNCYSQIKHLAESGNDVIFTTSPVFKTLLKNALWYISIISTRFYLENIDYFFCIILYGYYSF